MILLAAISIGHSGLCADIPTFQNERFQLALVVEKIAVFEIPYLSHICTVHESFDLIGILNDKKY